jgi:putative endonuclease
MNWYVYLLRCGNGDLYTGMTDDLERRLQQHQSGRGGWFTKTTQPVELVYHEVYESEAQAKYRETQLKGWSRRKKLALISGEREALKKA